MNENKGLKENEALEMIKMVNDSPKCEEEPKNGGRIILDYNDSAWKMVLTTLLEADYVVELYKTLCGELLIDFE